MVEQGRANSAHLEDGDTKHAAIYQKREESGETPDSLMVLAVISALETDLGGDLEAAWATTSQERITNAHVAGSRQVQRSKGPAIPSDTLLGGVRDKGRKIRIREIRMIEQVVGFKAQL